MKLPPNHFVSLDKKNVNKFVFVTGVSKNHFKESIDAIASAQAHFPGRKIYYYDIGLDQKQKKQVYLPLKKTYILYVNPHVQDKRKRCGLVDWSLIK